MSDSSPKWLIFWNEEGDKGPGTDGYWEIDGIVTDIIVCAGDYGDHMEEYRARLLIWLRAATLGDVLEFPEGIVVRTSEHATEIGYDREETGS